MVQRMTVYLLTLESIFVMSSSGKDGTELTYLMSIFVKFRGAKNDNVFIDFGVILCNVK